jgi:hypothetical protein
MSLDRVCARTIARLLGITLAAVALTISHAVALPITLVNPNNNHNFRDKRSVNDVGIAQGDVNQFGADISPPGSQGTSLANAAQGTFSLGQRSCIGLSVDLNFCGQSIPFNPALGGSWTLTFQNGTDTLAVTTPVLGAPPTAPPVPFPVNVTIAGTGGNPTFKWTVPAGFAPDAMRLVIFDKTRAPLPNGMRDVVHAEALAGTVREFTVPNQLSSGQALKLNNNYSLMLQVVETRGHVPLLGLNAPLGPIASRSSSFFDFTVLPAGAPPQVLLPTVGPSPPPGSGVGPTYQFDVRDIGTGQKIFIDPLVAVGYKYAIGVGNPNFASVTLPTAGDNIFALSYVFAGNPVLQELLANTQFFFPAGGVGAFDVTGIETAAMLDPNNVTAFITGLTFVGNGDFTGTMIPLVADVPVGPVPEPATLLLLGTTAAGIGLARWRHRKRKPQV